MDRLCKINQPMSPLIALNLNNHTHRARSDNGVSRGVGVEGRSICHRNRKQWRRGRGSSNQNGSTLPLILQTLGRLYCWKEKEKKNQRSEERRWIQNRMKKMTRVFAIQLCNFRWGRGGFEGEEELEERRAMADSEIRRIRAEGRKMNFKDELMKMKNIRKN
ncbi:hypothetical protein CRG98_036423 [Punica granatum]|uniref:Uncharacterized protein n=1 Tax=Punica granatum TaxID=22663 RepID=A0A2I0IGU2_PUNGR|nr:hypothetical protein CRG98_036423 [Punica granatum]